MKKRLQCEVDESPMSLTRTDARAFSTPSKLPHSETWLLFSVGLDRFESGKWIWVIVSSMIFLMLLPPRPMMYEWSVYEMSIFMMTRLPCTTNENKMNKMLEPKAKRKCQNYPRIQCGQNTIFGFHHIIWSTINSHMRIWNVIHIVQLVVHWRNVCTTAFDLPFLVLAPIFKRHGQLMKVDVVCIIYSKRSEANEKRNQKLNSRHKMDERKRCSRATYVIEKEISAVFTFGDRVNCEFSIKMREYYLWWKNGTQKWISRRKKITKIVPKKWYLLPLIRFSNFWRSTLNRSFAMSSGFEMPSCAAMVPLSFHSLSTEEISLWLSLEHRTAGPSNLSNRNGGGINGIWK